MEKTDMTEMVWLNNLKAERLSLAVAYYLFVTELVLALILLLLYMFSFPRCSLIPYGILYIVSVSGWLSYADSRAPEDCRVRVRLMTAAAGCIIAVVLIGAVKLIVNGI